MARSCQLRALETHPDKEKSLNMAERKLLGVMEAEAVTGISRWTWRRWAYDGRIASVKLGKRLLIPAAEIERLIGAGTRPALERPVGE